MEAKHTSYNTVLVIDDEDVDLFLAKKVLKKIEGVEDVILYNNGRKAFSFLKHIKDEEQVPDLILLDLKMPGFSGEDFLNGFQKLPKRISSRTKVVVVSAFLDFHEGESINSKKFPCITGLLHKPLNAKELKTL